ncbi:MAG: nucleocapsid [Dermacentor reticulatus rhabdovirus 1]|uniref:Nucleoprotein n=1 Tax=Dermacentor reticulatus rhabdovirus 1 TaxID=2950732 RepID=A0AAE9LUK2_9RHAB|nr:MAG: nucleocapsid [Dermacentor reticulatus rhabdovirus 1]
MAAIGRGQREVFGDALFAVLGPNQVFAGAVERTPDRVEPEFPSAWFREKNTKPAITVMRSADPERLQDLVYGGLTHGELEIDVAVEYLVTVFQTITFTLDDHPWSSYGMTIGDAGAVITPLNLLQITYVDRQAPAPGDLAPYQGPPLALVTALTCLYRLSLLYGRNAHDEYCRAIRARMTALLESSEVGGRHGAGLLPQTMPKIKDWHTDRSFRALMAALDMFLHKDTRSAWQIVRMGTLVSRGKDCAALGDLQRLARCLGVSPQKAILWVFETSMIPEIQWLSAPTEELGKADSYYHYCSDFGLTTRSPWSGTTCKQMHLWTNVTCVLLQSTEAMQTRYIECENTAGIISNAVVVAYANRGSSEARRIYYTTRAEAEQHAANLDRARQQPREDGALDDLGDEGQGDELPDGLEEPRDRDVAAWANFMFGLGWQMPRYMEEWAAKRVRALKNPRPGSTLEFLRKYFSVTD